MRFSAIGYLFLFAQFIIVSGYAQNPPNRRRVDNNGSRDAHAITRGLRKGQNYKNGELIIKLRSGSYPNLQEAMQNNRKFRELGRRFSSRSIKPLLARRYGAHPSVDSPSTDAIRKHGLLNIYRLELAKDIDVLEAAKEFERLPEVEYAEPNYIYHAQGSLNDPYLHRIGSWGQSYADLWGHFRIRAPEAWELSTGNGIVVAVIDTGCDFNHPDLVDNIWINSGEMPSNGIDDDGNGYVDDYRGINILDPGSMPQDRNGHGTHIAGTIAAIGNNGIGIAGVAFGAKIMPVRALDDSGIGEIFYLAQGIGYAVEAEAHVINLSWSGTHYSQVIEDAIKLAWSQNITVVTSAGNGNTDFVAADLYPATSRYVVTVGASDNYDRKAHFSNYGATLDVLAPGGENPGDPVQDSDFNILSLMASECTPSTGGTGGCGVPLPAGEGYSRMSGTSMAVAYVSGLAALIRQRYPDATPEEVRQSIRASARDILDSGWDQQSGYGIIDAWKALNNQAFGSARILEPKAWKQDKDTVQLAFVADADGFSEYKLEYSLHANGPWTTLITSDSPALHEAVWDWDVEDMPDGTYILRLRVISESGAEFQDRTEITLDRVSISSPSFNATFRAGEQIKIEGRVLGGAFHSYCIEYLNTSQEWSRLGITLTGEGRQKIDGGVLGILDSGVLKDDGYYPVRLVVKRTDFPDIAFSTQLIFSPEIHTGWPRNTIKDAGILQSWAFTSNLNAADIDGDGQLEILTASGINVWAYEADGTISKGWPKQGNSMMRTPIIGDVNGDGLPEIMSWDSYRTLYLWKGNGEYMPGYPWEVPEEYAYFNCRMSDIDNDGRQDIVIANNSRLAVFDLEKKILPGWPQLLPDPYSECEGASIAISDVDNDGWKEIIVSKNDYSNQALVVFNSDGTIRQGWPQLLSLYGPFSHSQPVIADVNGDRKGEIIVYISDLNSSTVVVFSSDGRLLKGWPYTFRNYLHGGVCVGDITGDNIPEILVGGMHHPFEAEEYRPFAYALTGSGEIVRGWPVTGNHGIGYFTSFAILDIDGDGMRDVLMQNAGSSEKEDDDRTYGPSAFHHNGLPIAGFPKAAINTYWFEGSPLVMDFDGDGFLEIVWISDTADLYMWDLKMPAKFDKYSWVMPYQNPERTSSLPFLGQTSIPVRRSNRPNIRGISRSRSANKTRSISIGPGD
ncbi:MAG: S8 family serine peptidase [Acidobacteria bacterium]|nr:S8 family serine peptidase [Acidobacteriota bacterium]